MIETPKTISEWSEKVFPTLTKDSQLEKLIEETREFINAKTEEEKIKELADVYIVASILKERFDCKLGFDMYRGIYNDNMTSVYSAVDEKMKINRSRVWEFKNGVYHHIKEKENESA